jgi:DNA-binding CsgD family transcriptional regulator
MPRNKLSEAEVLLHARKNTVLLEGMLDHDRLTLDDVSADLPGIIHLNRKDDLRLSVLNRSGQEFFELTGEAINALGADFHEHYVHPETRARAFPRFVEHYYRADEHDVVSDFQYVKAGGRGFQWIYTCTKFHPKLDCLLSISLPVKGLGGLVQQVESLLDENLFLQKHFLAFSTLTKTEKKVLGLLARGLSNRQIAGQLYVSGETVKTHRKNIRRKLDLKSHSDYYRFAKLLGEGQGH